ncbi:MAG TPA: hypothetical protein PLJ21_04695 [Pseudobdellovibrionaceae bacterium]|nr:hypothetical protein [Pseudobdellovibrionaceae bacterium]
MTSLGVFVYKSLSVAYRAYNDFTLKPFNVLEISPLGGCGQVLVEFDLESYQEHIKSYKNFLVHHQFFNNFDSRIIEAYLSLKINPIQEGLLMIEAPFIGNSFEVAHLALEKNIDIVDLRLFRGENAKCILFLSAKSLKTLKSFKEEVQKSFSCELLEQTSLSLKELFA